jgi:hypothetical protein
VITGYQREARPCTYREKREQGWTRNCWTGSTTHAVAPMLVPSLYFEPIGGATVRLNYMPRWSRPYASEAVNLAVEYKFK